MEQLVLTALEKFGTAAPFVLLLIYAIVKLWNDNKELRNGKTKDAAETLNSINEKLRCGDICVKMADQLREERERADRSHAETLDFMRSLRETP